MRKGNQFSFTIIAFLFLNSFVTIANTHVLTNSIGDKVKLSENDFVTTWDTENYGTSNSSSITIPAYGVFFNYKVDWNNDGIFDQFNIRGKVTHNFGKPGIYTIRISGNFPRFAFNNEGDKLKITVINQWGSQKWISMQNAFWGCENLEGKTTDVPNLSKVYNLDGMFEGASSFNQKIDNWDTSNITNMAGMFAEATKFNQNLSTWDTSSVIDMSFMFSEAISFNQNLNSWDTSSVNTMRAMFQKAVSFNQPLNNWDTGSVADMNSMFYLALIFNGDIVTWDVKNTTDFSKMFQAASAFNQDISSWNTSRVVAMKSMFMGATDFDQNLSDWNVTKLKYAKNMFSGVRLSVVNYDELLTGWSKQELQSNVVFTGGSSRYCSAKNARAKMIIKGFLILDSGMFCEIDITSTK